MRGHMRERSKGTWELRVYAGRDPLTHRERYRTKIFKGGKRAAQVALARFVTEAGAGVATEGTFGDLVERWFGVASVSRDWSPKTVVETRRIIDTRLGPLLPMPLDKLRTSVLDDFYATLRTRGGRCGHVPSIDHGGWPCEKGRPLAAASVRRVHGVVHAALEPGARDRPTLQWASIRDGGRRYAGCWPPGRAVPRSRPHPT